MGGAVAQAKRPHDLESLANRIDEMSSFPAVATRVLEIVNNPDASIADLRAVVECDPALVSRLLRTVNSAAYALRSRVDSIHRAIALLGFNEIRNLAGTASVADLLGTGCAVGSYTSAELWRHLVSVGVAARLVASRSGLAGFEEAYMCGLLHDVGIPLLEQNLRRGFEDVISHISADMATAELERQQLGFDHTQLGAAVAKKWGFPASVVESIHHHHNSEACDGENQQIVRVVEVVNFLCSKKGITSVGLHNVRPPSEKTFSALSIGRNDLKVLWQDLDEELKKVDDLIGI